MIKANIVISIPDDYFRPDDDSAWNISNYTNEEIADWIIDTMPWRGGWSYHITAEVINKDECECCHNQGCKCCGKSRTRPGFEPTRI